MPTLGSSGRSALSDPTKSGSIAAAFENVIQQQMQRRLEALEAAEPAGDPRSLEARAVRQGWIDGLRLLQLVGANARYFTDTSQKPPIDVAAGDCAAGMCIDFYGREQQEAVRRRNGSDRVGYVSPEGGSAYSVDPIALLQGRSAPGPWPRRSSSMSFRWTARSSGTSARGPRAARAHFALPQASGAARLLRTRGMDGQYRSDPGVDPYSQRELLVHHDEWTGPLFPELAFVVRIMAEDTHAELVRAWRAIIAAPGAREGEGARRPAGPVSSSTTTRRSGRITRALVSRNQVDEVDLARDLGERFRANYGRAERIAGAGVARPGP